MSDPERKAADQPLPGSVSDQNAEEEQPGHDDNPSGHGPSRPSERGERGSGGEPKEGRQSTGNPNAAG